MNEMFKTLTLKDLIPLASALVIGIGWLVTYFFNVKLKTKEAFIAKTEEDIKNILGKMSVEIRDIWEEKHTQTHERKLKAFYTKYRATDSPLYVATNSVIIELFNHFQEHYKTYLETPSTEQLKNVYTALGRLEEKVNAKLKQYRKVLFKYYDWYYQMESLNPIIRLVAEVFRVFYQMLTGFTLIALFATITTLFEFGLGSLLIGRFGNFQMQLWPFRDYIFIISTLFVLTWVAFFGINLGTFRIFIKESAGSNKYSARQIEYNNKIRPFPIPQEVNPMQAPDKAEPFIQKLWTYVQKYKENLLDKQQKKKKAGLFKPESTEEDIKDL
ncbi:hypothetical protein PMSD_15540 [Paenibacillus macquariensis subsp. defensor]|nr:hypothetical protein PMSD_15540 [Paenibacillus macquariensis subsp. defensor]